MKIQKECLILIRYQLKLRLNPKHLRKQASIILYFIFIKLELNFSDAPENLNFDVKQLNKPANGTKT